MTKEEEREVQLKLVEKLQAAMRDLNQVTSAPHFRHFPYPQQQYIVRAYGEFFAEFVGWVSSPPFEESV